MLRIASGPISSALGPATCFPAGGGPCGADDADDAFTTFGVVAATFAVALCSGGYADAAAAAFAGGGDGGFVCFGAGDFAGGGAGGLGVCFTFDAPRRLDASICISLGGPFPIALAYAIAGFVAPLASPTLLDLVLSVFGGGADDGLAMPPGVFFVIRLIAAALVSGGKWSYGGGFVGIGCCGVSTIGGGDSVFCLRIRFSD